MKRTVKSDVTEPRSIAPPKPTIPKTRGTQASPPLSFVQQPNLPGSKTQNAPLTEGRS